MAKKLREQNPPGDAEISIEPEENPMEETKMEQEDKQNAFEQKEKIKEKIKKIEDNKIAAEKEKKEYEKLLAEKAEIEKSIQEIETLSVEYGKVENNLKGDRLALEEYCDEKLSQITKEIHYEKDIVAKMDKVDGKIKNIRDELKKVEGEKYKLGKIDSDEINHMKVQQSLRLEQKKFEDCKKYQKSIEGKIKELQELKKLVDSEYAKGNKKKAYFHIKDFQTKLDDQEIKNIKESDVFKECVVL